MTISVITVCYQAVTEIEKTMKSILKMGCKNYEYIVIDGASTDGTIDIIKKYETVFKNNNIKLKFISEKDDGIYDAMNKAISLSESDWCIFMNAGDCIYDDRIFNELDSNESKNATVVYGDTLKTDGHICIIEKPRPISTIKSSMPFCHQSAIIKTEALRKFMYNTSYKICADYDLFLNLYQSNCIFQYIPIVISSYDITGISSTNIKKLTEENRKILISHDLELHSSSRRRKHVFKIIITMQSLLPKFVTRWYKVKFRGWKKINSNNDTL